MALTKVGGGVLKQPIDVGIITATSVNASGIITAGTVQVGSATTIHSTGIDLGSGNITSHNINSTGIVTSTGLDVNGNGDISGDLSVSGNVSIGGTLTYEDVTNIDSVGLITARDGIIVTGGSVGIGTDNPVTNFKLDVNGDLSLGEYGGVDNTYIDQKQNGSLDIINSGRDADNGRVRINLSNNISGDTTYYRDFEVYNGKGSILIMADGSSGNVGIGTNNPDTLLHIEGDNPNIKLLDTNPGGDNDYTSISHTNGTTNIDSYFNNGAGVTRFRQGSTEALRITSGGNIGIGTDTPDRLLHLSSDTNTRAKIATTSASSFGQLYLGDEEKWIVGYRESHPNEPHAIALKATNSSGYINLFTGGDNERLRITSAGTLESYSPDDTTPNFKFRSDDTNWFGALNQSVHGATITTFLSCGGDWSANGTTYSATKALAAYPTSTIAIHNQYNNTWGSQFVFLTKAGGSTTTDGTVTERLRIDSNGHLLHGVTADEDTSGSGGLRFINSGDIQIDGDQKALVFRSTNNTAQLQSAIEWWNENGAGVQAKIACDRTAVSQAPGDLVFYTNANVDTSANNSEGDITERLRINSDGKVGINNTNPSYMLEVQNPNPGNDSKQSIQRWVNNSQNTLELHMYGGSVDQVQFAATNQEQTLSFLTGVNSGNVDSTQTSLLLTQTRDAWFQGPNATNYGGGLFIGVEASPYGNLCALRDGNKRPLLYMGGAYPEITLAHSVPGNTSHGPTIRFATYIQSTNTATGNQFVIGTNGSGTFLDIGHATAAQNANAHNGINSYSGTRRFRVTTSGCQVNGSLSKSSGSFRIDHPLVGLSTTRDLVHSFIEGPQADLIYRGVVDLVDGTATVNIDTAGRMTEGTFEVLCTNVSCFTSNETDWTAVKGSVSGNILTITAQDNTSTATVSWMVVGERKDPHMIDTDWTDENGRVITEPLKSS